DKTFYSVRLDQGRTDVSTRPQDATRCSEAPVSHGDTPVSYRDKGVSDRDPIYSNHLTDNHSTDNHFAALADREPSNPVSAIRQSIEKTVASHAETKAARRETRIQRN